MRRSRTLKCSFSTRRPSAGLSTAGGFTFVLQNRGGADTAQLSQVLQGLLAEARKRPEIGFVYSGFDPRIPQIEFAVDRDKVKSLGIQLSDVFFALQTFLGSYYVNDFNLFGRTYRVQAQAEGAQRGQPDDVNRFYVRSDNGTMVPLSHAGEQPTAQRSAVFRALQRLQRGDHQRNECARLQLRPGHRRHGGARPRAACGLRLRVERGDLPGEEDRRADRLHLRGVAAVRDSRAGRPLRKLGDAGRHPAGDSVRRVRRVPGSAFSGRSTTTFTPRSG